MRLKEWIFGFLFLAICSGTARAQDGSSSALLSPNLVGEITLAEEKKRAALGFQVSDSQVFYRANISAPLDSETRRAQFFEQTVGLASGFASQFSFGWDSALCATATPAPAMRPSELPPSSDETPGPVGRPGEEEATPRPVEPAGGDREGQAALEQTPAPVRRACGTRNGRWLVGGELGFEYDRLKVFDGGDVATAASDESKYQLRAGGQALHTRSLGAGHYIIASARAGFSLDKVVETAEAERCQTLPSSDDSVSGQSCKKILVATGDEERDVSGYLRLSFVYLRRLADRPSLPARYSVGPSVDLLADSLFQDKRGVLRVQAVATPITEGRGVFFGVGASFNLHDSEIGGIATVAGTFGSFLDLGDDPL